ncbi:MAG TPA: hypothetical protein VFT32_12735, partial [Candidatus Eisenbacteria bacterium]|nr:hypothetical protein [Candidatus Eisenbacteria bacterium]
RDSRSSAHALINYFAWRCPEPKVDHLTRLLAARDPTIRVGAAVYLAIHDSTAGIVALREFARSTELAGFWASLALARRGELAAADSCIEGWDRWIGSEHEGGAWTLRARLLTVLSNSARSSGLEQPPIDRYWTLLHPGSRDSAKAVKRLRQWWRKVRERISLVDPWLPEFASKGLD